MARKSSKTRKRGRQARKQTTRRTTTRRQAAVTRSDIVAPEPIVNKMDQDELDRALATGQHRDELQEYFGPDLYRELSVLAGQSLQRSVRGGPPVAILPGIMGSEISIRRGNSDQLIWISYLQVFVGHTRALSLGGGGDKTAHATGVLERYYTKLRLRLQSKGYDARFVPFDWRRSVVDLGAELLKEISDAEKGRIHLVCHSMGGLVARAAAHIHRKAFDKIIQLGTPNFGSFSPVTAFRGANPTANKVAALDQTQSVKDYIKLFASFPGLLEMIPNPARYSGANLLDRSNWPSNTDAALSAKALAAADKVQKTALADGDKDFWLIAGVDQDTIVGAELDADKKEFTYLTSTEGDGTVPLAFALLDNVKTYFVAEEHGALPNNSSVADAVDEIIRTDATTILLDTRARRATPARRRISETQLIKAAKAQQVRGAPTAHDERHLLDEFLSVDSKDRGVSVSSGAGPMLPAAATAPEMTRSRSIVVGRRRQRGIEIKLAHGSITEVDARAIVLGIYEKVTPAGAAAALDGALHGAIGRYIERRMFNGTIGEIAVIPTPRRQLKTEFVVFTGLGGFDQFTPQQLQTIGTNLARILVDICIEDIAMVAFGGGTGFASDVILRNFLTGFFAGLADADADQIFRRLTICELDPSKYNQLVDEILRLTTTDLFDGIEATVDQIDLPEPPRSMRIGEPPPRRPDPIYLMARRFSSRPNMDQDRGDIVECSILSGGASAAILTDRRQIDPLVLDVEFRKLDTGLFSVMGLERLGHQIADEIVGSKISDAMAQSLLKTPEAPLIVIHDAGASRVPWEAVRFDNVCPALAGGLTRRYMSQDLSVAKWLTARVLDERLEILLIVDPTEDLPGAENEGQNVRKIASKIPGARLTRVEGAQATKATLLEYLQSGKFDVVHYAGHAFFDPAVRQRSGILCAGGREVLSSIDLASLTSLPALVVCNACQSGQIRGAQPGKRKEPRPTVRMELGRNVSFAESFLRGGVANYVGTTWSVGDTAASGFAETLYSLLAEGSAMNEAVTAARKVVEEKVGSKDWADYIHYGDPTFVLKSGEA